MLKPVTHIPAPLESNGESTLILPTIPVPPNADLGLRYMIEINLEQLAERWRVSPGQKVQLHEYPSDWAGDTNDSKARRKEFANQVLTQDVTELAEVQDRLYASASWSILIIFQAMDAAGKDSTIKHVMSGVNPQGCQVFSFKQPSAEELSHHFLWRYSRATPERGRIGIFNRSYYEEVLVVRVHPELIESRRIPDVSIDRKFWADRYADINAFEHHLSRNGTRILKFFLNLSRDEQRKRFLKRLVDPRKHWKFSQADLKERELWDDYKHAFEEAIEATSTKHAPWYIIPADHKWVTRALVARIITHTLNSLDLRYPDVDEIHQATIARAITQLENEGKMGRNKKHRG